MTSDAPVPRWSLVGHAGSWAGSNAFRLMPTDEPHRAPANGDRLGRRRRAAESLALRMDNVVPASAAAGGHAAGAYWAMDARLRRSP